MEKITPSVSPEDAVSEVTRLVQDQPGVRGVKLSEITITVTNTSLGVILPILNLLRSKGIDCPLNFQSPILKRTPEMTSLNNGASPSSEMSGGNDEHANGTGMNM